MATLVATIGAKQIQGTVIPAFQPTQIPGIQMWLDGADPLATGTAPSSGATVATWSDKSGNGYNGTGVSNPTYVSGGGISFNGSSQYYTTTYTAAPTQETAFVIAKFNSVTSQLVTIGNTGVTSSRTQFLNNNRMQISVYGIGGYGYGTNNVSIGTTILWDYTYSGGTIATYYNGNTDTVTTGVPAYSGSGTTNIGFALSPYYMNGTIYEIIIFNTVLSTNQRQVMEGFLAWKWGLNSQLPGAHPFYSSAPVLSSLVNTFSPTSIPGIQMWLDGRDPLGTGTAPSAGATVATWSDKSGQGFNGTGVANPTYVSGGGILFNGSSHHYTTTYSAAPTQETAFVIFSSTIPSNSTRVTIGCSAVLGSRCLTSYNTTMTLQLFNTTNLLVGSSNISANTTTLYNYTYRAGGTSSTLLNGNLDSSISSIASFTGQGVTHIGGYGTSTYFSGTIYEVIIFNTVLTNPQRQAMEGFLAWKWGLNSNLPVAHPYSSYPPNSSSLTNQFNPLQVPGLASWYDASDPYGTGQQPPTGTSIPVWTDKSGNGRNLIQYSSYAVPTYTQNAVNALPTIDFTNASGLYTAAFEKSSNVTMLMVCMPRSGLAAYSTFWGHYSAGAGHDNDIQLRNNGTQTLMTWHTNNQNSLGSTILMNSPTMYSCTMAGGTSMFMQQTNTAGTTSFTNTETLTWTAGSASQYVGIEDDGNKTNSYICEILYYQYVLTTRQRQVLEGYLAWKWGLQSYLPTSHRYYYYPPTQSSLPTSFSPTQFPGLNLWLDGRDPLGTGVAPANGTNITTWADKSTNGRSFTGSATYNATSTGLTFNGTTNFFSFTQMPLTYTGSVAYVVNITTAGAWDNFFQLGPIYQGITLRINGYTSSTVLINTIGVSETNQLPNLPIYTNQLVIFYYTFTGTASSSTSIFFEEIGNGTLQTSNATASRGITPGNQAAYIGTYGDGQAKLTGVVHEILYFNSVLPTARQQSIEGYLAWKWGLQGSLPANHPFKYFTPAYDSLQALTTVQYQASYLPGLQAWYDAADPFGTGIRPANGVVMSNWIDKSGNSNTMEARGAPTYTTGSQNNLPGITIAGNSGTTIGTFYTTQIAPGTFLPEMDCFVVYKNTSAVSYNALITRNSPGAGSTSPFYYFDTTLGVGANGASTYTSSYNTYNTNTSLLNLNISQATTATSKITGYTNGTAITFTLASGGATWTPIDNMSLLCLGGNADTNTGFNGLFYEVMVFNFPLSTEQREFVEGYLAWKWGLNASLPTTHLYYSAIPNINTFLFQPNQIVGLTLWLDGADPLNNGTTPANAAAIATWFDKSPNAINGTGTGNPTFVSGGGISFNGTNQSYTMSYAGLHTIETGFIVMKQNVNTTIQDILHGGPSTREIFAYNNGLIYISDTGNLTQPIFPTTSINIFGYSFNASATVLYSNATQTASGAGSSGLVAETGIRVGAYCNAPGANWYNGNIYEVIIFNTLLSTQQRQVVEGYLASKWNLQASLPTTHPYYTVEPSLLTFVPSYTGITNILSNAASYLPLKGNATDIGIYPQTVTTNGTVTYSNVLGKNAAYFNNSLTNFLSLPMSNLFGMTIAFWFNTQAATYYTMAGFTTAAFNPSLQFDVVNSTTLNLYTALPNQWTMAPVATFLGPNTWNFIAVTINQNTFVETVYMNGSNASSATGSAPFSLSPNLFVIGRSGDTGRAYEGYIQNFMYFNTVLTGAQVNILYEQTLSDLAVPNPPTALSLTFSSPTLAFSWTGGLNTTSYLVEFYGLAASGTSGGALLQVFSNVTATSQNFSGTPTSSFCYATVTPVNSGRLGAIVTSSAVAIPQTPAAPTSVTMGSFAAGQTTISVSWTASAGATSYTVNFLSNAANSTSGGTVWQTFTGVGGTSQTSSTALRSGANGTYYYATVTAVSGGGSSTAATSSGTVFYHIPLWVSGNILWLDGNDQTNSAVISGNNVTQWRDKSGLNNHTNSTSPVNPQKTTLNSLNAVAFSNSSATSNFMRGNFSAIYGNSGYTLVTVLTSVNMTSGIAYPRVFLVGLENASTPGGGLLIRNNTRSEMAIYSNNILGGNTNPTGTGTNVMVTKAYPAYNSAFIMTHRVTATAAGCNLGELTINGNPIDGRFSGIGAGNTRTFSNYSIANYLQTAANFGDAYTGTYGEILLYNSNLTETQRAMVEGYLAWKWGTTATLNASHAYKNASP